MFASTVEALVKEWGIDASVTLVSRQPNGKTSIKLSTPTRDHWLNFHESLLSHDLARTISPNVVLGLREC